MSVSGGRADRDMAEQAPDDRQALAERQRPAGIAVTAVVKPVVFVEVLTAFEEIEAGHIWINQPQTSHDQPSLSVRMRGIDGTHAASKSVACSLRWQNRFPCRSDRWIGLGELWLRQPLLHSGE